MVVVCVEKDDLDGKEREVALETLKADWRRMPQHAMPIPLPFLTFPHISITTLLEFETIEKH